jgi:hypothetical protein
VADLNCDGIKDLIVLAEDEQLSTSLYAFFGKGGGEFLPVQEILSENDLQTGRTKHQTAPNTIQDFFASDLNGDRFVDLVVHSTYQNSVVWNMTEVAFGKAKFSGIAGNRPDVANRDGLYRNDVINYGQFFEDAVALGLNPSLQPSPQQKYTHLGYAENPSLTYANDLRIGNYYTIPVDATIPTQLNISSGKSSLPDISFSLNNSVSLEMSEAVPVVLGPTTQNPSDVWGGANAMNGKYSFSVDNSISGINFISNFGIDDTLSYQNTPQAVATLTLWGAQADDQILVTNYKDTSSKIITHGLWVRKEISNVPSKLLDFVPDTGQARVVLDHKNIGVLSGTQLSLDESDFDIDLSQIDFKVNSKNFLFNNFDSGDTLRLPSGYQVNKFENGTTNGFPTVTLEIDAPESDAQLQVRLVGVSSVNLEGGVYVAGST